MISSAAMSTEGWSFEGVRVSDVALLPLREGLELGRYFPAPVRGRASIILTAGYM